MKLTLWKGEPREVDCTVVRAALNGWIGGEAGCLSYHGLDGFYISNGEAGSDETKGLGYSALSIRALWK
jgi:hypothetical protein